MIHIKKSRLFILIIAVAFIAGSISYTFFYINNINSINVSKEEYNHYLNLKNKYGKLDILYNTLDKYYYKNINKQDVMEGIYKGVFSSVKDPYTTYMTESDYENIMIKTTGEFQGIGVNLAVDKKGNVVIVSTIKDTPAQRGGLESGDIIKAVEGVEYKGESLEKIVANLRGEAGTKVRIKYIRKNKEKEISLTRAKIMLQSVFSKELPNNIGYIYISNFEDNTGEEFKKELHSMEMKKLKGVIIDLRNNGGGVVRSGVEVADELLGEGILAYTEGKDKIKKYMNTKTGKTSLKYVVLINGSTASTSEIVVAGIKDNKGGKIVGTKSFGKGVIQSISKLPEGDAIKMTIAQYFSPKGKKIHGIGIKPDYEIENDENDKIDRQLEKALEIIKNK